MPLEQININIAKISSLKLVLLIKLLKHAASFNPVLHITQKIYGKYGYADNHNATALLIKHFWLPCKLRKLDLTLTSYLNPKP